MNLRVLLSVYGALSVIGGALWIVIPGSLLSGFGAAGAGAVAVFLASMFGGAALGLGVMSWMARGAEPSGARHALVLGITVTNLVWGVLALMATLAGNFNALAWVPVATYAIFTVLFLVAGRGSMNRPAPRPAG